MNTIFPVTVVSYRHREEISWRGEIDCVVNSKCAVATVRTFNELVRRIALLDTEAFRESEWVESTNRDCWFGHRICRVGEVIDVVVDEYTDVAISFADQWYESDDEFLQSLNTGGVSSGNPS